MQDIAKSSLILYIYIYILCAKIAYFSKHTQNIIEKYKKHKEDKEVH